MERDADPPAEEDMILGPSAPRTKAVRSLSSESPLSAPLAHWELSCEGRLTGRTAAIEPGSREAVFCPQDRDRGDQGVVVTLGRSELPPLNAVSSADLHRCRTAQTGRAAVRASATCQEGAATSVRGAPTAKPISCSSARRSSLTCRRSGPSARNPARCGRTARPGWCRRRS